ncbi:MAG: hypothetical protein KME42_24730 [Tildeniella nuda ZEHNDER 1965/U140]|jgi:hypothetical protein|nr:hypothetical protein [Tildeniella nuda ZEHNDER 1965/U140]
MQALAECHFRQRADDQKQLPRSRDKPLGSQKAALARKNVTKLDGKLVRNQLS